MTNAAEPAPATPTVKCPYCDGKGSYLDAHEWSDGLGMVTVTCGLCDGKGSLSQNPTVIAHDEKKRRIEAEGQLRALREKIYFFMSTMPEKGDLEKNPLPGIPGWPGATTHHSVWRASLEQEIAGMGEAFVARVKAEQLAQHDEFHKEPKDHPYLNNGSCMANSRRYCAKCFPELHVPAKPAAPTIVNRRRRSWRKGGR